MADKERFGLLRKVLQALGLKPEAIDEIVERIVDLLSDSSEQKPSAQILFPYHLRDDFLSAAEHSFYLVLQRAVGDWAVVCPKVSLGDLFCANSDDYSEYRTYTNKIDRKHVDFLLCEPGTVRPLLGVELDDKSHQRSDRQTRDEFVEGVFAAAKLPLARVAVQQNYNVNELRLTLQKAAGLAVPPVQIQTPLPEPEVKAEAPRCPKCGSEMILRVAKSGANAGGQFWGCSNFPRCHGVLKYEPTES